MIKKALKESGKMLKGKRLEAYGLFLIYLIFCMTLTITTSTIAGNVAVTSVTTPILGVAVILPMAFGLYYYFLNLKEGTAKIEDLIAFYIDIKTGLKLILASLWYLIVVLIGFILFIVPGIIWSYRYICVFWLLIDNRDMTIKEAFDKSKEMMHGHKFKFFLAEIIVMLIPMIIYFVGAAGLVASGISSYSVVRDEQVSVEVIDEEEVLSNPDATADELMAVAGIDNETVPSYNVFMIVFAAILFIGCILMLLVAPRCIAVETAYYIALRDKE